MKKFAAWSLAIGMCMGLVAWGYIGHQTVARIAENHLTPQAKAAIHKILGSESIVDIASWADEVRNQPEYKNTASWHFVNVELGLSYEAFAIAVKGQSTANTYSAIRSCENVLKDKTTSSSQKATALKFIVHLIGDAHQPMHVSRAEDKGGNNIQVQFNGKGTNLHSLWDSGLIGHEGLSYAQMAANYDTATPQQIKQWQNDEVMKWLYESYQISSTLYEEVERNNKLDDSYYKAHLSLIQQRIELGGIRLAGILNELFTSYVATYGTKQDDSIKGETAELTPKKIDVTEANKHIGQAVAVTAKVYGIKDFGSMVLVNVGAAYPESPLTVILRGEAKSLAAYLEGKTVTVIGTVIEYKGKPEIEVISVKQISIEQQ